MFEHLLLLAVVVAGMTFVRLLRRSESHQRGYLFLVGALVALGLWGLSAQDGFIGVVVVSMVVLAVVVPWALEGMARRAFAVGRLGLAVRLAGLRAIMMPGGGLGRQQDILHGLAVLERDGVDAAIGHFRGLAGETDDGGELAVIHEQIVSMLFYGQRWNEGIAHYEGQFHPGYAALRPALALGLMRAYGEAGRLANAAGLLRALEEGPLGSDPRALELVSQARLTFLAYAGQAGAVTSALQGNQYRSLGLSRASGALYRGIALARAGERDRAQVELSRVESLAGPKDDRVVVASRSTLAGLDELDGSVPDLGHGSGSDLAADLAPDLEEYSRAVAGRLQAFVQVAPGLRRRAAPLLATGSLSVLLFALYLALETLDRGGIGLLTLGALTPELWGAGSWARILTAPFLHADVISLLVNLYAVGLAGSMLERIHGRARLAIVAVVPAAVGLWVGCALSSTPSSVMAGGTGVGVAIVIATLVSLRRRGVDLAPRVRRSMSLTLAVVLTAQLLTGVPGVSALDLSWPGLGVTAALAAAISSALPLVLPRPAQVVENVLAAGLCLVVAGAAYRVSTEDVERFAVANRITMALVPGEVEADVPPSFVPVQETRWRRDLPITRQPGLVDTLQLRTGNIVSLVAVEPPRASARDAELQPGEAAVDPDAPALFHGDPSLARRLTYGGAPELPSAFRGALGDENASAAQLGLRVFTLRRNSEPIARVIERRPDPEGPTLVLIASPPSTLDHAPRLYGSILADLRTTAPNPPRG